MLDVDALHLSAGRDRELVAVCHHPRRETIDLRHRPGDRLSPHWPCAAKQRGDHRAEHGGPATAEDVTPVHRKIIMIVFDGHDALAPCAALLPRAGALEMIRRARRRNAKHASVWQPAPKVTAMVMWFFEYSDAFR